MSELVYYDLKKKANITPSMPQQLARELGRRIIAGSIESGTMLDDENALAERYEVSRVVVRDAVKILVGKGLLDVRRGIGTRVRPRDRWIMLDDDVLAWHQSAPPSAAFLSQLMEIRIAIEPKASRWAAQRASDEDIKKIEEALIGMEEATGTTESFIIADALFHKAILQAAKNEFLSGLEGVIYSALLVSVRITNKDPRDNGASIPFHRDVYQAIADQNADLAEELTHKLLSDASNRLKSKFNRD